MPDLTITSATAADADDARRLLLELGYDMPAGDIAAKYAVLERLVDDRVLIARLDGRAIGLGALHVIPALHVPGSLGRITVLIIAETARGLGVGRRLVEMLEEAARAAGCTRMEVTSGDHRPGAHAFYQRLGYAVDERRFIKRFG